MKVSTRERLLQVLDILAHETDDEHEVSLKDIEEKLKLTFGANFTVKRNILSDDLQAINDNTDVSVTQNKGSHGKNLFSHQERLFEMYEIRMLMDAVMSARFMSYKEAKRLIKKIKKLTSNFQAKTLPHELYINDTIRNESAYSKYDIDRLHKAISDSRCIAFQYGKFDANLTFSLRRGGEFYPVKPYALTWNDGFYYLIGEYEKEGEIRHYRVDRMRNVHIKEDTFKRPDFNVPEYINRSFNMFAGTEDYIEIEFKEELLNPMIDRFGIGSNIRRVTDQSFSIKTKASTSPGLVNWILGWGSGVKVLAPEYLVQDIREEVEKMQNTYC